ncbi:MAG: hypothetical protein NTW87_24070, partial [Planctomycetota bacterium]|nr:hypothetical protein [Planctomycetota bacterium]
IAALCAATASAGQASRKNKRQRSSADAGGLDWHESLDDALDWAKQNKKPAMLVIFRPGNQNDVKQVAKLGTWPALVDACDEHFAAAKLSPRVPAAKAIARAAGVKSSPAVVWLDQYGNPIKTEPIPDSANPLADTVKNWPNLIGKIEKFLKERTAIGDKLLTQGHLREAYLEFSTVAPYKGPFAEKAQQGREKVKESWRTLVLASSMSPPDSRERRIVLDGLLQEVEGTDCEQEIRQLVAAADKTARPVGSAKGDAPAIPPAVAAADPKPATPPAAPDQATKPGMSAAQATAASDDTDELDTTGDGKSLADLAATAPKVPAPVDAAARLPQLDVLREGTDQRLKETAGLLQEGIGSYKRALADSMERGPARNKLLKSAYASFDKASSIIQESTAQKPDPRLEKLLQQIAMMMYGCVKYQSL